MLKHSLKPRLLEICCETTDWKTFPAPHCQDQLRLMFQRDFLIVSVCLLLFPLAHAQHSQGLVSTVSESLNPAWQAAAPSETANVTLRLRSQVASEGNVTMRMTRCSHAFHCSRLPLVTMLILPKSTVGLRNKSEVTPVWVSPDSRMRWMHSGGGGSYRDRTNSFLCFGHRLFPISLSVPDGDVSVCLLGVRSNPARTGILTSGRSEGETAFLMPLSQNPLKPTNVQLFLGDVDECKGHWPPGKMILCIGSGSDASDASGTLLPNWSRNLWPFSPR